MTELEELTANRFKAQHAIAELQARVKELEKENKEMLSIITDAINILDGNKPPIEWRKEGDELLRKLSEHLESIEVINEM